MINLRHSFSAAAAETARRFRAVRKQDKRVGMVFSGGPAPAANKVMFTVQGRLSDEGYSTYGFRDGYRHLATFSPSSKLSRGEQFHLFSQDGGDNYGLALDANAGGVHIGTSRTNPGRDVKKPAELEDAVKSGPLTNVMAAFESLRIGALVSIGGDDTLTTACKLSLLGVPVVHVPKTIDRDLPGVETTFGFDTVVEGMAREISSLGRDAVSTGAWYVVEVMGRKAGWITVDSALRGNADRVVLLESLQDEGLIKSEPGSRLDLTLLAQKLAGLLQDESKRGGVIVLAEGLAGVLPDELLPKEVDTFGHLSLRDAKIGALVRNILKQRTGKKVEEVVLGYAYRCAKPNEVDLGLGRKYGIEAAELVLREKFGRMVDGSGRGIDFGDLVDSENLKALVRMVPRDHALYQAAVRTGLIKPV